MNLIEIQNRKIKLVMCSAQKNYSSGAFFDVRRDALGVGRIFRLLYFYNVREASACIANHILMRRGISITQLLSMRLRSIKISCDQL